MKPDELAFGGITAAVAASSGAADTAVAPTQPLPDRFIVITILENHDQARFPKLARRETTETLLRDLHHRLTRQVGLALRAADSATRSL